MLRVAVPPAVRVLSGVPALFSTSATELIARLPINLMTRATTPDPKQTLVRRVIPYLHRSLLYNYLSPLFAIPYPIRRGLNNDRKVTRNSFVWSAQSMFCFFHDLSEI